jgi:hypothetical protein
MERITLLKADNKTAISQKMAARMGIRGVSFTLDHTQSDGEVRFDLADVFGDSSGAVRIEGDEGVRLYHYNGKTGKVKQLSGPVIADTADHAALDSDAPTDDEIADFLAMLESADSDEATEGSRRAA